MEHVAADELLHGIEEILLRYLYAAGIGCQRRSYADELHNSALSCKVAYFLVKGLRLHAALEDVAQYECAPASLMVWTAVHEVKSYVKRVYVGVIGVVDERASVMSLLYLKAHGYRLKAGHPLA